MRSYEDQPSGTLTQLRELRRSAPPPERRLLRGLREAFPHLKWRHQSPIGPFRVDILCFSEQLVIEVDGDTHAAAQGRDANRTRFIEREGYRVLRVTNAEVIGNLEGVLRHISFSLREKGGGARRPRDEGDARPLPLSRREREQPGAAGRRGEGDAAPSPYARGEEA